VAALSCLRGVAYNLVSVVFRADFFHEVAALSCLRDVNIVSLIGVCCQTEPLCIVTEYMKYGDLKMFLQMHLPDDYDVTSKSLRSVSLQNCNHGTSL